MAKQNIKVFADLGLSQQYMLRHLSIFDTGAGPNFIIESLLLPEIRGQFFKKGLSTFLTLTITR